MTYAYTVTKMKNVANVSTDRILKLIPTEDAAKRRSNFNLKIYEGGHIHAIQESGLWYLEYRQANGKGAGVLPEMLKQRWTNFNQLIKFLAPYFENRGIKLEEVIA